ncbi:hypothetical protein [Vibrio tasmaniensis]|uniref:hypothetical protein n=1 Tax=Vibrio tasmaniensis TaxID=212663 RepID=UPI00107F22D4|nr:hypothetical protein [Vibrio tasmaniensis]
MDKQTTALSTLLASTLLITGYLGYHNYSASIQNSEASETITTLNKVIDDLTDEMANMNYVKTMDDETYESQVDATDKKLVEKALEIEELSALLAVTNAKLAKAEKSAKTYRSRYFSEKNLVKNAKLAMNQKLEKEKVALEKQNQQVLASQMSELEGEYSKQAQRAETEKRVDELMTDFADLRVDLDIVNKCDRNYLERYGEAKSMLNHMRTYIQQYELSQEYYFFVISNDAQLTRKTREICIEG